MGFVNLLTPKNPILVKLFSIPFCFIVAILSLIFVLNILSKKSTKKQFFIFGISELIINSIFISFIPNAYLFLFNTLLVSTLIYTIYIKNILTLCLIENVFLFIKEICILSIYAIFKNLLDTSIFSDFSNLPITIILINFLQILFLSTLIILAKVKNIKIDLLDTFISTNNKKMYIDIILENIISLLSFTECILIIGKSHHLIDLLCILIFTYFFFNEFFRIKKDLKLNSYRFKIKTLEIYNENLNTKYDELSAFKHDFNNIIQTIGGLLLIDKYDNLKNYYKELKVDCQVLNDMEILNPIKIKNPEVFALLVNKYKIAKQNGIKINLDIYSDLSLINSDIFQIIRILGILLDNAIEATKECTEKVLNIEFRLNQNTQTIIIENSYLNKDINTENIFSKGFSTKKGNTGLGLWKVRKIINQHENWNLFTYKNYDFFTQKLDIPIQKIS